VYLAEPVYFPDVWLKTKAIVSISDDDGELINAIKLAIENTLISNAIKFSTIDIENFTVFKHAHLTFSDGLNVVIGENGTGKSHLLKLLYAFINSTTHAVYADLYARKMFFGQVIAKDLDKNLAEVFKAGGLDSLISRNNDKCLISICLGNNTISFSLDKGHDIQIDKEKFILEPFIKSAVFIPAKEMLSFYEGFVPLYENRETSFDAVYYNLAKALALPPLKNLSSYPVENGLLAKLEALLDGKIRLERGRFYLAAKDHKTEIALIAEGLRKIATLAQLIANGSLTKHSILFWDEPETNLNPKLITKMAEALVELSRAGMQIFIATHSLFLIKEIEILRASSDHVKYFGLGFDQGEIRVSQNENFEYLDDIAVLDAALEQNDRFLSKPEN
jgi:predicted ATPase